MSEELFPTAHLQPSTPPHPQSIHDEIDDLERRLLIARAKAKVNSGPDLRRKRSTSPEPLVQGLGSTQAQHFLFLLSDSALPLGSFAFSSGLESYLAHKGPKTSSVPDFLTLSLSSYASTTLPFVLAAHRDPTELLYLDDAQDAAIMCTVGRRASVAQGRALLSIWDKSFSSAFPSGLSSTAAVQTLKEFSALLRSPAPSSDVPPASAHLGPLFGAISRVLGLDLRQTAYVFMLSHVKALLSAAVRAGTPGYGPYHAQKVLASVEVQAEIERVIEREWETRVENAGQTVPVMDLWIGRHEMLYSRIFNS